MFRKELVSLVFTSTNPNAVVTMPTYLVPLQLLPFKLKHLVRVPSRTNLYLPKSRTEYTTIYSYHLCQSL